METIFQYLFIILIVLAVIGLILYILFSIFLNKFNKIVYGKQTVMAGIPLFNVYLLGKLTINKAFGWLLVIGIFLTSSITANVNGIEKTSSILPSKIMPIYSSIYYLVSFIVLILGIVKYFRLKKENNSNSPKSFAQLQLEPINVSLEALNDSLIDRLKQVLYQKYNIKIEEYNKLKAQIEQIENQIVSDNSKEVYENSMEMLKKQKLKKKSSEYKEQIEQIETEYKNSLLNFQKNHNDYIELRRQISMIDIYGYTKKIERVKKAKEIKDLNLDEEKASKILSGELDDIN